jgi:Fe2+ or Zn2+ uptake regulation protein
MEDDEECRLELDEHKEEVAILWKIIRGFVEHGDVHEECDKKKHKWCYCPFEDADDGRAAFYCPGCLRSPVFKTMEISRSQFDPWCMDCHYHADFPNPQQVELLHDDNHEFNSWEMLISGLCDRCAEKVQQLVGEPGKTKELMYGILVPDVGDIVAAYLYASVPRCFHCAEEDAD